MFFKQKLKVTDAPPQQVAFFYAQYIELMKYGEDCFDYHLKKHLFDVLISLGVPNRDLYVDVPPEEPKPIEPARPEKRTLLVHGKDEIRKLTYGVN